MNDLEFIFMKACMDADIDKEKEMWEGTINGK